MTVRVLEVTPISAPKRLLRGFHHPCANGDCLAHDGVDLPFTTDVMAERELGGAPGGCRDARIKAEVRTREKSKLHAMLQVEDNNGAMLEFGANNAFGFKPESIAVELERRLQVVNSQCDHSDSRLHRSILLISIVRPSDKRCRHLVNSCLIAA